ncbi:SDR family oxidoreductase [Paralcaligenes sp. KSB-10]|uniref:SDR family NAD(P)-dependent oxidoreductase n=1 Tax=Paralcaligenes sp. KSB-10 TaxID=2901142 RepID=UPI001E5831EA|nr:SDR family oxidoreductase [Paralcaligenes sp. KSB-10]UHL63125.1 SDR family oxidoreductase [Paralcaligenes sp. KSB-10]
MNVALVTGGGDGIGRAISLKLAQSGFKVAIADIDHNLGTETVRLIQTAGGEAVFIKTDVSNGDEVSACVDKVEKQLGPITAFSNNAGIEGVIAPIHHYPDDIFERLLQVNVKGVFLGLKHVLARMISRGQGAIVNTASTSSIRGRAGLAGYVATKHAVLGLTRVAALDVAGTKIRINAVLPGPVETRMIKALDEQAKHLGGIKRANSATYASPDDIANVVVFLLSDQSAHVNGAAWVVDGGVTAC